MEKINQKNKVEEKDYAVNKLSEFAEKTRTRLDFLFNNWINESEKLLVVEDSVPRIVEPVKDFTLRGGKRLRPALAYFTALGLNSSVNPDDIIDPALSLELLQSYLLIHDDIMDEDEIRRGGPTVHVMFRNKIGDGKKAKDLAILAGDIGAALAHKLIIESKLPLNIINESLRTLNNMNIEVIHGQKLDLISYNKVTKIHSLKTASYTTVGPMLLGAAIAGADEKIKNDIKKFAHPVGIAFQLRDDVLGTFGNTEKTGKSSTADLKEGKNTILVYIAKELNNKELNNLLDKVLGNKDAPEELIEKVKSQFIELGVLEKVETEINRLSEAAFESLEKIPWINREFTKFFKGITYLLIERDN